jgi:hypothetical protein
MLQYVRPYSRDSPFYQPAVRALQVAERSISKDLELLISRAVDPVIADYAGE